MTMTKLEVDILSVIVYADIFSYPMTLRELVFWTPQKSPVSARVVLRVCKKLVFQKKITYNPPFYFIPGHERYVLTKIKRLSACVVKWQQAYLIARILRIIPTIDLVGVTGGLSMNNAMTQDDIDIIIIAHDQTLWVTRFLATLIVECTSRRRRPNDREYRNSICLNMFMTNSSLCVPKIEHGWYTSHEVLQMVPLWERNGTYKKFMRANAWVKQWFPAAYTEKKHRKVSQMTGQNNHIKPYWVFEQPLKALQLWYMRKRRTKEVISDTLIRFHPVDARVKIRKEFIARLRHLKVPLDKTLHRI